MSSSDRPVRGLLWGIAVLALASCTSLATTSGDSSSHGGTAGDDVRGVASYYAHEFHGRTTASGEVYDENALTAAHRELPFGTRVLVTNLSNERDVVVRINDRGPFVTGRIIDLSYAAARRLDFIEEGITTVRVEVVEDDD